MQHQQLFVDLFQGRPLIARRPRAALLLAAALALPAPLAAVQSVSFRLVPASSWERGRPRMADEVKPGRVQLYREGAYAPELVIPAGDGGHPVLPGRWLWIADAPGYVSVGSGVLEIPAGGSTAAPRVIVWPVVPACELTLRPDRRWQSMTRLDLVSLSYATVYPLDPKTVRAQKVPAGRYLAYAVGARGLLAIGKVSTCKPGEARELAPPEPPAADRQDLLVHVTLPAGESITSQALAIALSPLSGRSAQGRALPAAALWNGRRGSFFFLGVPAAGPLELAIGHPALRTRTLPVEALGGSARELPEQAMKLRRSLRLLVDYRPVRAHRSAKVVAYACGARRLDPSAIDVQRCRALARELPLAPGPSSLVLENLDDGQYELDAVVDDETVYGLGNQVAPYLDPETDSSPGIPPVPLPEFEVYGNLRVKGEPVPGEVRLRPHGTGAVRRFASDRDLLYHLFYFGYLADRFALHAIPEDLQRSAPAAMRGLYDFYSLEACGRTGTCRLFNVHSTLTGGGRLDLDLGSNLGLDVEVVSRATGEPVAEALVGVDRADPALHFREGKVEWRRPAGREGEATYTDARGRARVRNLDPGSVSVVATKEGWKLERVSTEVREGVRGALRIELDPDAGSGTILRFADGSPVGHGYLLAIDETGARRWDCSRATDSTGAVELPPSCLDRMRLVLLHPEAAVTAFPGSDWMGAHEITVERAPARPVTVRISDPQGRPLAGIPVAVRFRDLTLGPNDLLAAATQTGALLFYLTDDHGEATLQGIDPASADLPEVTTANELRIKPVPLAGTRPGGTVEIVAPD